MKILLINNGSKHIGKLKDLLSGNKVDTFELFSKYPQTDEYDVVILSGGSRFSLIVAPEIFKQEIELIKETKVPIVGICQGCEIIAKAFGSHLDWTSHKVKGIKKIDILSSLSPQTKSIEVYEAHHLAIKKLGKNLIALAKSQDGYEIIKHIDRPIFGMQFHPEMVVDKNSGDEIFNSILFSISRNK